MGSPPPPARVPTVGLDCMVILDGQGYWIDPTTYHLTRERVRREDLNKQVASGGFGAGSFYFDRGPGKREWSFVVLAHQGMRDYTGNLITTTGQFYRDALHNSYNKVNTELTFVDPQNVSWSVRFDELVEELVNSRAQADGFALQYAIAVTLVEA